MGKVLRQRQPVNRDRSCSPVIPAGASSQGSIACGLDFPVAHAPRGVRGDPRQTVSTHSQRPVPKVLNLFTLVYRLSFLCSITLICLATFARPPALSKAPKMQAVLVCESGEDGETRCGGEWFLKRSARSAFQNQVQTRVKKTPATLRGRREKVCRSELGREGRPPGTDGQRI
jgi:hypothetical protein